VLYVIRLSTCANSDRKNLTPKDTKTKRTFHGVSRHFHPFKVPTKGDAGKSSLIWTQWTWKISPRSVGFDAGESSQSRQAQHQIPICPVQGGLDPNKNRDPTGQISFKSYLTLNCLSSMVSTSWMQEFGVCHERAKWMHHFDGKPANRKWR